MPSIKQLSFSSGELAPALYARADTSRYASGLKVCRNFISQKYGGATNRSGFAFIAQVKNSSYVARLIKFVFNAEQTYILEFGQMTMRVFRNGIQILTGVPKTITGISQASPGVVTSVAHGFSNGDEVYLTGIVGMIELNGRNVLVSGVTANTFDINDLNGVAIDTTGFTAYTSGGTAEEVYEIATPYAAADLMEIQYVQSADIITLVHPSYPPYELSRLADNSWTLLPIDFSASSVPAPEDSAATGAAGAVVNKYRITEVQAGTLLESLPGFGVFQACLVNKAVTPWDVTAAAHGYATGDEVVFLAGTLNTNETRYIITVTGVNNFDLNGTAATAGAVATNVALTYAKVTAAAPSGANPITVTWTTTDAGTIFNIYKALNGVYGFIGTANGLTFVDDGITSDVERTPPISNNPFGAVDDFPSAVGYFQQRLWLANTNNNPQTVWASRTGDYHNFSVRQPLQDDDSIRFDIVGRQVNEVRQIFDLGQLIILTSGGEWAAQGDADGVIRPTAINLRQQGYRGSAVLSPIVIENTIIYLQARGSVVRDLRYEFTSDGYTGNDLTIYSPHLFEGYQLVDWDFAQIPQSVVWVARNDGTLLGMTYVREQEVTGWHHHDTVVGTFENVAVVPEGEEDAVYVVVQRTIDGRELRFIERLEPRRVTTLDACFFVDSGLSYDGTNASATTLTLTGAAWDYTDTITITSSTAIFTAAEIGNAYQLTVDDETVMVTVTGFTSTTVVTGSPNRTVPAVLQAVATTDWCRCVDSISGLFHLEGQNMAVLGDGSVVANGVDAPVYTVTDGTITLDRPYCILHVGLPITADMETLDYENLAEGSVIDRQKCMNKITLQVEDSAIGFLGPDEDHLTEYKQQTTEAGVVILETGISRPLRINSTWNKRGNLFIRQTDPLPLTVLSVVPTLDQGGVN